MNKLILILSVMTIMTSQAVEYPQTLATEYKLMKEEGRSLTKSIKDLEQKLERVKGVEKVLAEKMKSASSALREHTKKHYKTRSKNTEARLRKKQEAAALVYRKAQDDVRLTTHALIGNQGKRNKLHKEFQLLHRKFKAAVDVWKASRVVVKPKTQPPVKEEKPVENKDTSLTFQGIYNRADGNKVLVKAQGLAEWWSPQGKLTLKGKWKSKGKTITILWANKRKYKGTRDNLTPGSKKPFLRQK
ncbi:hypothetical protein KAU11_06815 [Candidatus Babeliales bacterium]|nr:hypothetical protein [Candidatus Babeliales bacterium]